MCEFALQQDAVKLRLDRERLESASEDFQGYDASDREWTKGLRYKPKSKELENSSQNLLLILQNDPAMAFFAFNEMAARVQIVSEAPWVRPEANCWWRDADDAQARAWMDEHYGNFSERNFKVAFT